MIDKKVSRILRNVRLKGDSAILKYNKQFDGNSKKVFELSEEQIKKAYDLVDKKTLDSIKYAIKNLKDFAKVQFKQFKDFELSRTYGKLGQKIIPLKRIGCYVPGGRFPLMSSALMSIVPARVAGVDEIMVCSPNIKPEVVVAADMAGANRIFNIGGVQAIAALAYGTNQIPKVDKIVGPGNKFVAEAKRQVFGEVGIDCIAGPSEILIIADKTANKEYIEADLRAQKEHDKDAKCWFIDASKENFEKVIEKANNLAPEHLELFVKNPKKYLPKLRNYGSLFIGNDSGVVFGDYCSGTNHILPTNGSARYTGGLSVKDFIKILTYQEIKTNKVLIKNTARIARAEGLKEHKQSALIRLKTKPLLSTFRLEKEIKKEGNYSK
jgi:sulfopropanediol 3-dehydrogenase